MRWWLVTLLTELECHAPGAPLGEWVRAEGNGRQRLTADEVRDVMVEPTKHELLAAAQILRRRLASLELLQVERWAAADLDRVESLPWRE